MVEHLIPMPRFPVLCEADGTLLAAGSLSAKRLDRILSDVVGLVLASGGR